MNLKKMHLYIFILWEEGHTHWVQGTASLGTASLGTVSLGLDLLMGMCVYVHVCMCACVCTCACMCVCGIPRFFDGLFNLWEGLLPNTTGLFITAQLTAWRSHRLLLILLSSLSFSSFLSIFQSLLPSCLTSASVLLHFLPFSLSNEVLWRESICSVSSWSLAGGNELPPISCFLCFLCTT